MSRGRVGLRTPSSDAHVSPFIAAYRQRCAAVSLTRYRCCDSSCTVVCGAVGTAVVTERGTLSSTIARSRLYRPAAIMYMMDSNEPTPAFDRTCARLRYPPFLNSPSICALSPSPIRVIRVEEKKKK